MTTLDKELALFEKYKDAPKEVQDLGKLHNENYLALEKAKAQVELWTQELLKAEKEYFSSGKAFRAALNNWNPKEVAKLEEKA
jgi:hypothetical protein